METIKINKSGDFYFSTTRCTIPQKASIQNNNTQINDILIAPGYNLFITGNAENPKTLKETTQITGVGSCVNQYRKKIADAYLIGKLPSNLYSLDSLQLLKALDRKKRFCDSVLGLVFAKCNEPYADYFRKMEALDNLFVKYYSILNFANTSNYNYRKFSSYVRSNIPKTILDNPSRDEYLISESYRTWFISSYKEYIYELIKRKGPMGGNISDLALKQISKVFKNKVRDYYFYGHFINGITFLDNANQLDKLRLEYKSFSLFISDPIKRKHIDDAFAEKNLFFKLLKPGMKAPDFQLPDINGSLHCLSEFYGKVIFIDFWASWCGPCRSEIPALNELKGKYALKSNLIIISIAVNDGKAEWLKAIYKDKPTWLQLRDDKGKVNNDYSTNSIPRFVLIDRQGKIVTINAPKPSDAKELYLLLEKRVG